MSLGPDNTICKGEFVEAMRARLVEDDPALGAAVDKPGAQKQLGAMGQAVYRIATLHAEATADGETDREFWEWVAAVAEWTAALSQWQTGVVDAVRAWAPTAAAERALQTALLRLPDPGRPPSDPPKQLRGRIQ
jgi:hypothetical protein